jgi:drug/metabolite transporter (DMT)-like permease
MLPFGYNVIKVIPVVSTDSTMVIIYIGIAVVIAHLCWAKVLSRIEATKGATFLYSVPVMTIVIGFLWLDELPSIISCLGGAIILGGVILSNLKKSKHQFSL